MSALTPTRLDLTQDEPLKDAEAALRRCEAGGDAAYAAWAREWGGATLLALQAFQDAGEAPFDLYGELDE